MESWRSRGSRRVPSRLHIANPGAQEAGREGGAAAPHAHSLLDPRQQPHEGGTVRARRASSVPPPGWSAWPSPLGRNRNTEGGIRWSRRALSAPAASFNRGTSAPPRARASLSSPLGLTHSAPLPSGRRTFGRSYFSVLLASRLDGDVKPTKCPRRVAGATRGPPSARQRPWLGRKALSAHSSLALRAQPPDKTPLLGPASQPLTGGSDLLPQHRQRGPRSAAPFCLCMAGRPLS